MVSVWETLYCESADFDEYPIKITAQSAAVLFIILMGFRQQWRSNNFVHFK